MSRATVRSLVSTYLSGATVTGLNSVLRSQPRDLRGIEFTSGAPGEVSGAIAVVNIENQQEHPVAPDGRGGVRLVTYTVGVQVFHRSAEPSPYDAMDHFDAVVDALCNVLRSDPALGGVVGGPILSGAYESLSVEFGEPEQMQPDGGLIATWAVVRFPVVEQVQAT